jgi:hypothetical protein
MFHVYHIRYLVALLTPSPAQLDGKATTRFNEQVKTHFAPPVALPPTPRHPACTPGRSVLAVPVHEDALPRRTSCTAAEGARKTHKDTEADNFVYV